MLQMTIDGREVPVGSPARIVYMSRGRVSLNPPPFAHFHLMDRSRSEWPRYVPDPDNPGFSKSLPEGVERHETVCGRLIYEGRAVDGRWKIERGLDGFRADVAGLIGRPCRRCWA